MTAVLKHIRKTPITFLLVITNLIVMLILTIQHTLGEPDVIINTLASYTPAIIHQKEYYRLFTSMFLHFDAEHIFGNMLLLFFLGEIIEKRVGAVRYLFIYLAGGLIGNIVSLLMDLRLPIDQMPISAGASGAVFALIGAMAYLLVMNKGRVEGVTLERLTLLILLAVWDGAVSKNIDGAAHVGGLIAGFLLTMILCHKDAVDKSYIDYTTQGDSDEDQNNSSWQS